MERIEWAVRVQNDLQVISCLLEQGGILGEIISEKQPSALLEDRTPKVRGTKVVQSVSICVISTKARTKG